MLLFYLPSALTDLISVSNSESDESTSKLIRPLDFLLSGSGFSIIVKDYCFLFSLIKISKNC